MCRISMRFAIHILSSFLHSCFCLGRLGCESSKFLLPSRIHINTHTNAERGGGDDDDGETIRQATAAASAPNKGYKK